MLVFLSSNPIDVLALNETTLDFSVTDCEVFIPGCEKFRRDRSAMCFMCGGSSSCDE